MPVLVLGAVLLFVGGAIYGGLAALSGFIPLVIILVGVGCTDDALGEG